MTLMFLNGGAMAGEPLHHLLGGSPLVSRTTTAPRYRFYSVGDAFPALYPVAHGGAAIEGEVYDLPLDLLRDSVLPSEPHELELGVVELADGSSALAMLLRRPPPASPAPYTSHVRLTDITGSGSWREYTKGRAA